MKKVLLFFVLTIPLWLSAKTGHPLTLQPDTTGCQAFFEYEVDDNDAPLTVHFEDESQTATDIIEWYWQFGDGATSDDPNPSHTYADAGTYNVILIIVTADGCSSTYDSHVQIGACNCPDIYDPVCVLVNGQIVQFDNACLAECEGFTDFVDCQHDTTGCQAFFEYEVDDNDDPLTVHFEDESQTATDIIEWYWQFGDGATSDDPNPSHTYADAGTYNVILIIVTADGCSSTYDSHVQIGACNCPDIYDPVCVLVNGQIVQFDNACLAECEGFTDFVDCQPDTTDCQAFFEYEVDDNDAPLTVHFEDESQTATDIIEWYWQFGDGATSDDPNPSHTYADAGAYNVILIIVTADGCSSTYDSHVQIGGCNCPDIYDPVCVLVNGQIVQFDNACLAECEGFTDFVDCQPDTTDCEADFVWASDGLTVEFFGISSDPSTDVTWHWDFGNGSDGDGQNPVHTYAEPGVYEVHLTITTPTGCTATESSDVWIGNDPCDCPQVLNPVCVFIDTMSNEPPIVFLNPCMAECAGYDNFVSCDTIPPNTCEAAFGYANNPANPLIVSFQDYSYAAGLISTWHWEFGDGTSSDDQNPIHEYAEPGLYTVSLTITSGNCTSTVELLVYAGEFDLPACQAFFWPFPIDNADLTYFFMNLSFGDLDSWYWDFGDGTVSYEQNPTHTYAAPGQYTVTLTVSGPNCQSVFDLVLNTDDFLVDPNSPAGAGVQALYAPVIDLATNSVYFKDLSQSASPIVEATYNFGDGQTADAMNVSHIFPAKKKYNITYKVKNANGDISTFAGVIDLNTGSFKSATATTSVILANKVAPGISQLDIHPNPASAIISLRYDFTATGKATLELQSVTGHVLRTRPLSAGKGAHSVTMDIADLPQGVYILRVQSGHHIQIAKFVKE